MSKIFVYSFLLMLIFGCDSNTVDSNESSKHVKKESTTPVDSLSELETKKEEETIEKRLDEKATNPLLVKYFHPNMSRCGGALYGYYLSDELIKIESKYVGEFGYSSKIVKFDEGDISEIIHHQHYADYDKFRENYPDAGHIIEDKLTYTDTTYILKIGKSPSRIKKSRGKLISNDFPTELETSLMDCAREMKNELGSEKWLVDKNGKGIKP